MAVKLGAPVQTTGIRVGSPVKATEVPEEEGVLQELGEGIASGLIAIPQGIAELVGSGIDLMFDTNYSSNPKRKADELRAALGIDPEGLVGKGAEVITQFVVPGLGAASAVSKGSKLGKLQRSGAELTKQQKFALGAEQVAAAAGADMMVSTDGVTTIGDFFEGGPTETTKDTGLQGREEAFRKLTNKIKIGAETGAIVTAAPPVLGAAGAALMKTADVVGDVTAPVLSPIARGIKESRAVTATKDYLDTIEATRILAPEQQGAFKNTLADTLGVLRYRGLLPAEIAAPKSLIANVGEAEIKRAQNTLNQLDTVIEDIVKNNSEFTRKQILDNVEAYLDPSAFTKGKTKDLAKAQKEILDNLPTEVQGIVKEMRSHIDDMSKSILDSDLIKRLKVSDATTKKGVNLGDELSATIEHNLNTYLRRKYLAQSDEAYTPTKEAMEQAVQGFMKKENESTTLGLLQKLHEDAPEQFSKAMLGLSDDGTSLVNNRISREQAEMAAKKFLQDKKKEFSFSVPDEAGRIPLDKIRAGMFTNRERMPSYQRALLGEIRSPEEAYLNTIADLAEFKAVDDYFGNIRRLAETSESIGRMFIAPGTREVPNGYKVLGQEANLADLKNIKKANYGSLEGYAVPETIYNQLTRTAKQDNGAFQNALTATYSGFLRAKGFTQYGKTVLSPITQIRNVTSAALFATAQGNVGKGANLWESVRLVLDDIKKLTPDDQLKELQELQRIGVIGTQAELQEIRRLINEGAATGARTIENGRGVGKVFGEKIAQSRGGEFLHSAGKKIAGVGQRAEDLYQGGDNIWKIYNYKFEQSKLRNALSKMDEASRLQYAQSKGFSSVDDFIKSEAADIVRNTVPNYNLAPEAIKGLRKLPVGNFIAFPYEILRTSANTIARGIDELASEVPEIQKIGMRRLTGAATTFAVFPAALSEFAYQVSGVTEEEMEAFKRSLAAPWERNARLIPTGRDKNGLPTYINYSYTNPYDMLSKITSGAINKFEEGRMLGKSGAQATAEATGEGLSELFSPFLEESIITAKLRDVLPVVAAGRGGQTVTGARVYNPNESVGDQLAKSFVHVADALIPSAVPVNVSGGEFEAGRFVRSFVTATGLNDVLGVSPKDRQDRERQFAGEITRALTGVTENEINANMALKFKGYEFSEARQNTSNIFNRVARRPNLTNSEELLDAYTRANEARFQVFNKFHQVVEDLRTIGVEDREIKRTLKRAGVSGVDKLLRGRYEPLKISKIVRREMRRNDTLDLLPRDQIREVYKQQRDRQFGEPAPQPTETPSASGIRLGAPTTEGPTAPSTGIRLGAPIAPAAPSTGIRLGAPVSQTGNATSPILNPDPTTRALAEELERRRG
jgi:hypothetical protein